MNMESLLAGNLNDSEESVDTAGMGKQRTDTPLLEQPHTKSLTQQNSTPNKVEETIAPPAVEPEQSAEAKLYAAAKKRLEQIHEEACLKIPGSASLEVPIAALDREEIQAAQVVDIADGIDFQGHIREPALPKNPRSEMLEAPLNFESQTAKAIEFADAKECIVRFPKPSCPGNAESQMLKVPGAPLDAEQIQLGQSADFADPEERSEQISKPAEIPSIKITNPTDDGESLMPRHHRHPSHECL
ncbi:hypothetical protein BDU57DRAFT_198546 [Ampelomyces quisqualis]|uniref:Uncharacterized protein n=1 Tax=Ampelomyces quisqualis TaxID=50730 RepID=A0A6A5QV47_AMPQU|nr:hypothetical protein BDU57DRAFT_198546 [Ampelomyces quisqualis]